jgi:hypothetical protein
MGVVGGPRHYNGPPIAGWLPWKCPSCGVDNAGLISAGCTSCGSGSAQPRHVGQSPPLAGSDLHLVASPLFAAVRADMERGMAEMQERADKLPYHGVGFEAWWELNEAVMLRLAPMEIARLAWESSAVNMASRTMAAPPVTADVIPLNPKGKASRTIVVALQFFRDQILPQAAEEIASGEWCSAAEVDALVRSIQEKAQDEEDEQ